VARTDIVRPHNKSYFLVAARTFGIRLACRRDRKPQASRQNNGQNTTESLFVLHAGYFL